MKGRILISLVLIAGFFSTAFSQMSNTDSIEAEKAKIKEVINQETRYYATGQYDKWKSTWLHDDRALHTGASNIGFHKRQGWESIESSLKKYILDTTTTVKPEVLILKRDKFNMVLEGDMAWVYFISRDNLGDPDTINDKMESRVLKKVGDEWKIMYVNTIDISTYEE